MQESNTATYEPPGPEAPAEQDVRQELERVLASPDLQASERRRAFLRFIVEETLAGRGHRLKGYTVALAVFGRDESFDPQTDPVVRLEARRLRRDLDSYYVDAGSHDPLRISIPKGSYIPHFEWLESAPRPANPSGALPEIPAQPNAEEVPNWDEVATRSGHAIGSMRLLAAAAFVLALIAAAWWALPARDDRAVSGSGVQEPALVVLPFEALGSTEDSRYLADGISQQLVADLMRFPGFRLYTLPIGFEDASGEEPVKLARDLGVAYVVSGSVRVDPEQARVATQVFDAATGQVLWAGTYDRPLAPAALIDVQSELSGEISTAVGAPYGAVGNELQNRNAEPAVSSMQSYLCVMRAYAYRRTFSRAAFAPVLACLEEAVRRDPDYSDAWAMLGWLYLDAGRFEFADGGLLQEHYERALLTASQAVALEPNNTLALKALSSINHYMGHYEESERLARLAADLNPHDPDTLAQLGWRLAVRGNFEEGIPILKRAIERTVNPPNWYYHLVVIDLYLKGEYDEMYDVAQNFRNVDLGVGYALLAIACAEVGDREGTVTALKRLEISPPMMRDPAGYLRRHGAIDEIVDPLMVGLDKARKLAAGT